MCWSSHVLQIINVEHFTHAEACVNTESFLNCFTTAMQLKHIKIVVQLDSLNWIRVCCIRGCIVVPLETTNGLVLMLEMQCRSCSILYGQG